MRISPLLLAAALASGGCAYLKDRGLDLAQSVDLAVGLPSEGVEANLRATKLLQVGVGAYRGAYWFGLKDGYLDVWQEERSELGFGPLYLHEVHRGSGHRLLDIRHPLFGDPGFREYALDLAHFTDRGLLDVGGTVNVVFLGLDAAVRTAEILDFLAGLVTLDPLCDDAFSPSPFDLEQRIFHPSARVRAAAARALRLRFGEDYGYPIYTAPAEVPPAQLLAQRRWRERLSGGGPDSDGTSRGVAGAPLELSPLPALPGPEDPPAAPDPATEPLPGTSSAGP